jgi:hypothetical protein
MMVLLLAFGGSPVTGTPAPIGWSEILAALLTLRGSADLAGQKPLAIFRKLTVRLVAGMSKRGGHQNVRFLRFGSMSGHAL